MRRILDYLEKLELSGIEAKLYITLLESGPVTVRELARKAKINRTSAYPYIDHLIDEGLLMKVIKGSRTLVVANPPEESLAYLIKQKTNNFKAINEEFPEIIKIINSSLPSYPEVEEAEVKYYNGKLGIKKIYDEALQGSEFRLYVNLTALASFLLPNDLDMDFDLFTNALKKNPRLKIFEIIADSPNSIDHFDLAVTAKTGRYFYKFMPTHIGLTAPGVFLYDNKVAIINGTGKIQGIVFYNPDYYINSKKLFDFNWEMLSEPK